MTKKKEKNKKVNCREKLESSFECLLEEIKQGKSEKLIEYLKTTSRFHKYSFSNQILIAAQKPDATRVAGFKKWNQLGYVVKKGSKAIKILAPTTKKKKVKVKEKDEKGGEIEREEEIKRTYFVSVSVFDKSQVKYVGEGEEPIKDFFQELGDDYKENYEILKEKIEAEGIVVVEEELGATQGASYNGKISINKEVDYNNKFLTLIHELTHELLHWENKKEQPSKQVIEMQAEAVSYVVGQYLGIDNPYSSDYIQCFGNTVEELKEHLQVIMKASRRIIEIFEGETSKNKEVAVAKAS